jgi:glutathione S-transferase
MKLYFHPLSTYSQKTLIALYEKEAKFTPEIVNLFDPEKAAEYRRMYPVGKIPVLVDDKNFIPESSIIIEYIDGKLDSGPRLIPRDSEHARRTRFHDRTADLYVNDPGATVFFDARKPEGARDPKAVAKAREILDLSFKHLDEHLAKRTWLVGDAFSMADCALAPPLGYLRNTHPFSKYANLTAYWNRVAERPSVRRVLEEARPYLEQLMAR